MPGANLYSRRVLGLALMVATTAGCYPDLPHTPTFPTEDPDFVQVDRTPPGLDEDPAQPLTLYPGDIITIRTISDTTEAYTGLLIDEAGVVRVPLAGDVEVGGTALSVAEGRLEQALRQYDRTVRVSVVLETPNGHLASVIGSVSAPGRFPVQPGMRVVDLLAAAGGAARSDQDGVTVTSADLGAAHLSRNGEALPISIEQAMDGDPRHNVHVRPGDTLYVPADVDRLITVIGQIAGSRMMFYRRGMRLTHALALAGGIPRSGNWGDVRVIRGDVERPLVYTTSVADIVDGRAHDVVLAPGDIVYVASAGHADFNDVFGSISAALSLPITLATFGITASALAQPGGLGGTGVVR